MHKALYVGIDNGKAGAIAAINEHEQIVFCEPIPLLYNEYAIKTIYGSLKELSKQAEQISVCLEKAYTMPINGAKQNFKTGEQFGIIRTILELAMIPHEIVSPQTWQKTVFQGITVTDTKKASAEYCTRKYPEYRFTKTDKSVKIHDGLTDALCMAIYCKRTQKGDDDANN